MGRKVDVLVVGGGSVGINSAYQMAVNGCDVHVVEKGEICCGSSYGNAGLIVPSHSVPLAAPGVMLQGIGWMFNPESPFYIKPRFDRELASWLWKFRAACSKGHVQRAMPVLCELSLASVRLFEELATLDGFDFDFEQRGVLMACPNGTAMRAGEQEAAHLRQVGLDVDVLDRDGVTALEPGVEINCVGGIYYRQDAHLSPYRFVSGLAEKAIAAGAVIHQHTEVLGFGKDGEAISTVRTTRGDFQPEQVVLAGGSWSPQLVRELSLKLPIQPAKGYSITFARPPVSPTMPIMLAGAKVAVTPMGNSLRFAGTLELAGMDFSINRRRVRAIMESVPRQIPQLDPAHLELQKIWRGLRPCTPDGLPFVGRAEGGGAKNLVVAAGHAMIGLSLGPITGRLIAQIVGGERPDIDLSPLAVNRFD